MDASCTGSTGLKLSLYPTVDANSTGLASCHTVDAISTGLEVPLRPTVDAISTGLDLPLHPTVDANSTGLALPLHLPMDATSTGQVMSTDPLVIRFQKYIAARQNHLWSSHFRKMAHFSPYSRFYIVLFGCYFLHT